MQSYEETVFDKIVSNPDEICWNDIYSSCGKRYKALLECCRAIYRKKIDPNTDIETLDNCAAWAIEHDSHAAFAKYFIKKALPQPEVFSYKLAQICAAKKCVKMKADIPDISHLHILKPQNWKSYTYIFTDFNEADKKDFYDSQMLVKWAKGVNTPMRSAILQIGICLGMDKEELDALLMSAGEHRLYIMDMIDACVLFYLQVCCKGRFKKGEEEKRLIEAKQIINKAIAELKSSGLYSDNVGMESGFFFAAHSDSKRNYQPKIAPAEDIMSFAPLGWNIEEEISLLGREGIEAGDAFVGKTYLITMLYQKEFDTLETIDDFITYLKKNRGQPAFTQKPYGFLYKTMQYINNTDKYKKNAYYSKLELSPKNYRTANQNPEEWRGEALHELCSLYFEKKQKSKQDQDPSKGKTIKINLIEIIRANNTMSRYDEESGTDIIRGRSLTKQMIEGRQKRAIEADGSEKRHGYVFSMAKKEQLMSFALATGNEDEIGNYLALAGVWPENFIQSYWNSTTEEAKQLEKLLSRSDCFILYALKYRDRLIEKWSETTEKDPILFKNYVRKNFPMIKLMLMISRDIEFIFMKCEENLDAEMIDIRRYENNMEALEKEIEGRKSTLGKRKRRYEERLKNLINSGILFPTIWFSRSQIKVLQDNDKEPDSWCNANVFVNDR